MAHFISSRQGMFLPTVAVGAITALCLYAHYKSEKSVYERACAIGRRVLDSFVEICGKAPRVTSFLHVEKAEEAWKICHIFFQVKGNDIPAIQRVYLFGHTML